MLALFVSVANLRAQALPAGTQISNVAQVSWQDENGLAFSAGSNTVVVTVGQVAGVDVEPPRSSVSDPGTTVLFAHTLENIGNGTDSFTVAGRSIAGWPVRIYLDANGNGALDSGEPIVAGPIPLVAGASANLLLAVDVPGSASVRGTTDSLWLTGTSQFNPGVSDSVADQLQMRTVGIAVSLSKSVDRPSASPGDLLSYTMVYQATGPDSAVNFQIADLIPVGSSYLAGSLRLNGVPLTDASGDDAGTYEALNSRVVFALANVPGGSSGTVGFQVRVNALQTITNVAGATYQTIAGTDSVASNAVQTAVVSPEVSLLKTLTGPSTARVGEPVQYQIAWANTSPSAVVVGAVVTDTIPDGLDFASSLPAATLAGRVLQWSLGDLAAGSSGQIQLTLTVSSTVTDTQRVSNTAVLTSSNAPEDRSTAAEVVLVGPPSRQLSLSKTADVVEVSLGETAPFTLVVGNRGAVDLTDIQIHDRLPEGTRYAKGTATGVDSVHANGLDLTFFIAGPLAPGADRSVHYAVAVVSAQSSTIQNTAYAVAGGLVRSADAVAMLRVSSAWAMQDRAVIGKVWIDENNNGVQDAGEVGMPGVDVWTEAGDISTTDADGRFSFRNLQPGTQHAFRPDPGTLPAGYQVADKGVERQIVTRDATGWTTPRVDFRLVPSAARVDAVRLPIGWSLTAHAVDAPPADTAASMARREQRDSVAKNGYLEIPPLEIRNIEFGSNKSAVSPAAIGMLDSLARWFRDNPDLSVILRGHTDATGSVDHNRKLSEARATAVMRLLAAVGVDSSRLIPVAFGSSSPIAGNQTAAGRAQNRRVELRVVYATQVRDVAEQIVALSVEPPPRAAGVAVEVGLRNGYAMPLAGLSARFPMALDSAVLLMNDSVVGRASGTTLEFPVIPAHGTFALRGWGPRPDGAATAELLLDGRTLGRLDVAIADSATRTVGVTAPAILTDHLPDLAALPAGGAVAVTLAAPVTGWRDQTSFVVPAGWQTEADSGVAASVTARNIDGGQELAWKFPTPPAGPIELLVRPAAVVAPSAPARIEPLRLPEARAAEQQNAFLAGPGVEIFSPADGSILRSDRVFIGVRGEAGAPVTLFDGDSVLAKAQLRPDGSQDFIGVALRAGPHRLRVRMQNSWSKERWDSVSVHVTGVPASVASEAQRPVLAAGGQTAEPVRVRVLDAWGVPVVNHPQVTVEAQGATVVSPDLNPSSVGVQVAADDAGWLTIFLRPGNTVMEGSLLLSFGTLHWTLPLDILPAAQPLLLTGSGMIGIGATYDAYGAVTARGSLDQRTTFQMSYDSRRLDAGTDAFGRIADPLAEGQYPILGDASLYRTSSASTYEFSARVERGYDWLAFGDIGVLGGLTTQLGLSTYQRALPGLAARYTTGAVVWQGFGAITSQLLQQIQIRGAGISGPYQFGSSIRYGTEHVTVQTRERNNAEHILSREVLTRFIDYQIDYETGTLLLKRPLPAEDTYGNPVYLVVLYEAESGGATSEVWGVRADVDGARFIRSALLDSVRLGATWINESPGAGGHQLLGADLRFVERHGLRLGGEVSLSNGPDSSGTATALDATYGFLSGAGQLSARWLTVSREFGNPSNPALQGGTSEVNLGAQYKQNGREFQLGYNWQRFEIQDQEREEARASVLQPIGTDVQVLGSIASHHFQGPDLDNDIWGAEAKVSWKPDGRFGFWTEGRLDFGGTGAAQSPSYLGVGASFDVTKAVSLEARHRRAFLPGDSGSYSVTDLGVRTRIGAGTEAYGSYQIAGVSGIENAALVGLRNLLHVGSDWTLNTMFERRVGISAAGQLDPVRAAPFLQQEEDYWAAAIGAEYLPQQAPYRLSARAELKNGDINTNRLLGLAGDVSLNPGLALLTRLDLLKTEQNTATTDIFGHRYVSLWGLAFRPTRSNKLNLLGKFQWINVLNPSIGSVLGGSAEEERIIVAAEAIYAASPESEVGLRVASRRASSSLVASDGENVALTSLAHFVGLRGSLLLMPLIEARLDGRLLLERTSGTSIYQISPQLAFLPQQTLEVVTGYRFGDLRDPDFANDGGDGWFITFSARVTEQSIASAADFWRQRFGGR